MKVLFYCWDFGAGTGGIGQYLHQMAVGLSRIGHTCIVVTGNDNQFFDSTVSSQGNLYQIYNKKEIGSEKTTLSVMALARKLDVDFIEGADHRGECSRLLDLKSRPPVFIKYHSCHYLRKIAEASVFYNWQKLLIQIAQFRMRNQIRAERHCVENADFAIAPSQRIVDAYKEQGATLPQRLAVIPNVISEIPESIDGFTSRPTILFAGRLEILKGIQYVPKILSAVKKHVPDVILEIAGSDQYARGIGSLRSWLSRRLGPLEDSVRYLGHVTYPQLAAAYKRSWIVIFPSKWDNFPMTVLEAMSHGRPVVTTPFGGMAEMLQGTGAPICHPESEEFVSWVVELLSNEHLRKNIGEMSRQRVLELYVPKKVIPQYLDFVSQCIY
jgi:glycosyltransferase involved in cell wall biosynthesis